MNAIYRMAPILEQIEDLNERLIVDPFLGKGTVAVSKIETLTPSLNAVPDGCSIYLDRRLTIGETVRSARAEIEALPAVQSGEAEIELLTYMGRAYTGMELSTEKHFPTWVTPEEHPGVQAAVGAGGSALGRKLPIDRWVFSTNGVASAGKLGIPTIGFGPADERYAHSPMDQCPIGQLAPAVAWYAAFPDLYLTAAGHSSS